MSRVKVKEKKNHCFTSQEKGKHLSIQMKSMAAATSTTNGRSNRSAAPKAIVILRLSPELLSRFASPDVKEKATKKNSTSASPPVKEKEPSSPASSSADLPVPPSSVDNASDAASTPAPGTSAADTPRRNGLPAPKSGTKRSAGQATESFSRPRGKPGPKKKPRLYVLVPSPSLCLLPPC